MVSKKTAPKSLRKPSGKKADGQDGHPGSHLAIVAVPDDAIMHMPSACGVCPHYEMCKGNACVTKKRHVIDAVVTVNITEHQALEILICILHGENRKGEFSSDIIATVQYGENLQVLAIALNTVGAVSIKHTHEILSGAFGVSISMGIISNMVKRCSARLTDTIGKIKEKMIRSGLGHFDETGTRVDKKLWWVHDASNCEFTYLNISPKRGFAGMEQCGVLTEFQGIAVYNCWAS